MKKSFGTCLVLFVVVLSACGENVSSKGSIEHIVSDFYKTGYDYKMQVVSYESDSGEVLDTMMTTEGQVFVNPYREHVTYVTEDSDDNLWTEAYYEETKTGVRATLITENGSTEQMIRRNRPYGYGENIIFEQQDDIVWNDTDVAFYTGAYTVNLGKNYRLSEELIATVTQEYYVDKETETLLCIVTDTTDLNRKNEAAVNVSANGADLSEALADAVEEQPCEKVIQTIYHYGDPTEFEMP